MRIPQLDWTVIEASPDHRALICDGSSTGTDYFLDGAARLTPGSPEPIESRYMFGADEDQTVSSSPGWKTETDLETIEVPGLATNSARIIDGKD